MCNFAFYDIKVASGVLECKDIVNECICLNKHLIQISLCFDNGSQYLGQILVSLSGYFIHWISSPYQLDCRPFISKSLNFKELQLIINCKILLFIYAMSIGTNDPLMKSTLSTKNYFTCLHMTIKINRLKN